MKTAVVSALYGGYNRPPAVPSDLGVPAIMYTDDPHLDAPGWEVRYVNHGITTLLGDPARVGPMLAHKWWKLFAGLDEHDVTIWLDASMTITAPGFVGKCLAALGDHDLAFVRHPWRDCIYDEAEFSAGLDRYRDEAPHIRAQASFYRNIAVPAHRGLVATGFYVRRDGPRVRQLMADWWWEIITRSHQDQVSLPVLLHLDKMIKYAMTLPWHDGRGWVHLGGHLR